MLAKTLIPDPQVLMLDEPASGLDPRARIEIREILKELARMGKTILISSHILHELSQLCSQIGILEAGELVFEGPLSEINRRLGLMQLVHAQVVNASEELTGRVRKIRGVESVEARGDRLSIRVRAEALAPEALLEELRTAGASVRMFQPESLELETAFLKLTEGRTA